MELRSRLARGAGIATAGFFLSRTITFSSFVALAALIEPSDAGQLAAGTVLVGAALLFSEGGMLSALIQWREEEQLDDAASTAFVSTLCTGVLLTVLGVATAPLVGLFFDSRTVGLVAAVCSGWLFLRALQVVPDALLQRRFSFVRRIVIDPLGALAFGTGAIIACSNGMGVWGLVIGTYCQLSLQMIAAWAFVGWRPQLRRASWAMWRRLAAYARHVVASEIVRRVTVELDSLILGRIAGTGPLGEYKYGQRLASTPMDAWITIASYVLLPGFARIADDLHRMRRAYVDSLAAMCTVLLPVSLLLIPLGDEFALLAFGPEWPQAGTACKGLAGIGVGYSIASISSEVYKAIGKPQLLTRMHGFTFVASIILMPALAWGEVAGIAIAISLVSLATAVYALRTTTRLLEMPLRDVLVRLSGLFGAALVALGASLALDLLVFDGDTSRLGTLPRIAAVAATMFAVFLLSMRLLAPAELRRGADVLSRLRSRRKA
jgi:PST family polysaccharide transporter